MVSILLLHYPTVCCTSIQSVCLTDNSSIQFVLSVAQHTVGLSYWQQQHTVRSQPTAACQLLLNVDCLATAFWLAASFEQTVCYIKFQFSIPTVEISNMDWPFGTQTTYLSRQTICCAHLHTNKTPVSNSDAVTNSVLHYCHSSDLLQCQEFIHEREINGVYLKTVICKWSRWWWQQLIFHSAQKVSMHQLTNCTFPCIRYLICKNMQFLSHSVLQIQGRNLMPRNQLIWVQVFMGFLTPGHNQSVSIYTSPKHFILLLWLYSAANKKLKCFNAVLLPRVRAGVCVCVCVCVRKS